MSIKDNIDRVLSRINETTNRCGATHTVQLIAVSKTQPLSKIVEAHQFGINQIGENKIQEAVEKFTGVNQPRNLTKRFIGHLQSNKINKCLALFDAIDSVDSIKLANKINTKAKAQKKTIPVLLEVNTTNEIQKIGFNPSHIDDMLAALRLDHLSVSGLMTIGPRSKDVKETRSAFKKLRKLKENLNQQHPENALTELSMGMTGDFETGIEEGSTMVRIGTAIFGKRKSL